MHVGQGIDSEAQTWRFGARTEREAAFRRARRHSRTVRILRYAVPGLVVVVASLYLAAAWFSPFDALSGLPQFSRVIVSGTKITMDLPRLAGYTRDGRAYELTATTAMQDLKKPQFIDLQEVRGRVQLQDGNIITITAQAGVYDSKSEAIVLRPDVHVASSDGTEVRLNEARVDIRKGHVVSEQPVTVLMRMGQIDARQMEITDAGGIIQFRGGVVMDLKQTDAAPQTSRAEAAR